MCLWRGCSCVEAGSLSLTEAVYHYPHFADNKQRLQSELANQRSAENCLDQSEAWNWCEWSSLELRIFTLFQATNSGVTKTLKAMVKRFLKLWHLRMEWLCELNLLSSCVEQFHEDKEFIRSVHATVLEPLKDSASMINIIIVVYNKRIEQCSLLLLDWEICKYLKQIPVLCEEGANIKCFYNL